MGVIIDFELAGPNYRGFDLMKVFRTSLPMSEDCMRKFFRFYAEALNKCNCNHETLDVEALFDETRTFEPLTWLEAAIFFLALPQFKASETQRWHELARDRWSKWRETQALLLGDVA